VTAFPKTKERITSDRRESRVVRDDLQPQYVQQRVERRTGGFVSKMARHDHAGFLETDR
jgi:hypothetical protein